MHILDVGIFSYISCAYIHAYFWSKHIHAYMHTLDAHVLMHILDVPTCFHRLDVHLIMQIFDIHTFMHIWYVHIWWYGSCLVICDHTYSYSILFHHSRSRTTIFLHIWSDMIIPIGPLSPPFIATRQHFSPRRLCLKGFWLLQ